MSVKKEVRVVYEGRLETHWYVDAGMDGDTRYGLAVDGEEVIECLPRPRANALTDFAGRKVRITIETLD